MTMRPHNKAAESIVFMTEVIVDHEILIICAPLILNAIGRSKKKRKDRSGARNRTSVS